MSFSDESFSRVYAINTVYFWNDLDHTMAEIRRVLKPGGVFINTLYTNETLSRFSHTALGYKRYTPEQLMETGENSAFSVKAVPIMNGAAYSMIYAKEI
jgi:ubiquinone/menaquinone biosynthesis C-methylase UbiE